MGFCDVDCDDLDFRTTQLVSDMLGGLCSALDLSFQKGVAMAGIVDHCVLVEMCWKKDLICGSILPKKIRGV